MTEPRITINGYELSEGQAMTVRVALETFALSLTGEGLGQDETGTAICRGYLARIEEIRRAMFYALAAQKAIQKGSKPL